MKNTKQRYLFFFLLLLITLCLCLSGCNNKTASQEEGSPVIPDLSVEDDTLIEYETIFDPEDTTITEIYEGEDDDENTLDAEGETTVEIEIPEE